MIAQIDNYNPPSWGKLGALTFNRSKPVVQFIDEETSEILYTLRIKGTTFTPHAPKGRRLTVKAGIDAADTLVIEATSVDTAEPIHVTLP